jgi:hypothetical protein
MSNKKSFDRVEKGIKAGAYKTLRLLKKDEKGAEQIIYSWNKAGTDSVKERFEFIKMKLPELGSGSYLIECATSHTSGIKEKFPIDIIEKQYVSFTHTADEVKKINTEEPQTVETMPHEIDWEEYKELVKENERLKGQIAVLSTQRELEEKYKSLNDPAPASGIATMLQEYAPTALQIFDKFLSQRDRQMDIRERELSLEESGLSSSGTKKKIKRIAKPSQEKQVTKEDILLSFQQLSESDPEQFEAELDALEEKNPELFDYICQQMDLYDSDEVEEETE